MDNWLQELLILLSVNSAFYDAAYFRMKQPIIQVTPASSPTWSEKTEECRENFWQVLQSLLGNKLYVKPEKCEFHVSTVSFLECIFSQARVQIAPATVNAVSEWSAHTNLKQLPHFLGFANFYRFTRNSFFSSSQIQPINSLLRLRLQILV